MIAVFRACIALLLLACCFPAFGQTTPKAELSGTLVLDLSPQDTSEAQAAVAYRALAQTLARAADLEPFLWREKLALPARQKHPLLVCHGMGNTPCVRHYGQASGVRYLIYGELRGLDDLTLLTLELMDVKSGRILESVRRQISDPRQIAATTGEAACHLTRLYGCTRELPGAAAPAAQAAAQPASEAPKSDHDIDAVMRESAAREKLARSKELDDDAKPAAKATAKAVEKTPPKAAEAAPDESDETPKAAPQTAPAAPKLAAEKAPARRLSRYEKAGWSLVALSAASLGGGIGCSLLADKAYKDYTKASTYDKAQSSKKKTKTFMYSSFGLYGLSAAGLAGGVTLLVLGARQAEPPKAQASEAAAETPRAKPLAAFSIAPQLAPDGFGLTLGAAF